MFIQVKHTIIAMLCHVTKALLFVRPSLHHFALKYVCSLMFTPTFMCMHMQHACMHT